MPRHRVGRGAGGSSCRVWPRALAETWTAAGVREAEADPCSLRARLARRCSMMGCGAPDRVLDARLQPTACASRAAMSGTPRSGDWHERRVPAWRTLATGDAAPDGRPRRLRCRGRVCNGRRRAHGHSAEHRETSPCRPACAVGPYDRAADLRRTGIRSARRAGLGAPLKRVSPSWQGKGPGDGRPGPCRACPQMRGEVSHEGGPLTSPVRGRPR